MRSTGEVMGWAVLSHAHSKGADGRGTELPTEGNVFLSIRDLDKTDEMVEAARGLLNLGFKLLATRGTAAFLGLGLSATVVNKAYEAVGPSLIR